MAQTKGWAEGTKDTKKPSQRIPVNHARTWEGYPPARGLRLTPNAPAQNRRVLWSAAMGTDQGTLALSPGLNDH